MFQKSIGLRLRFHRDLTLQFQFANKDKSQPFVTPPGTELWNVLGSLDYMTAHAIRKLDELSEPESEQIRPGTFTSSSYFSRAMEFLLIPSLCNDSLGEPDPIDSTLAILNPKKDEDSKCLLFILRITLSSVALDLPPGAADVEKLLESAFDLIRARFPSSKSPGWADAYPSVWHTLGGPDIVCLASPTTAHQIAYLNGIVKKLRSIPLSKIHPDLPSGTERQCHAFSSVQATLCFRGGPAFTKLIDTNNFRDQEDAEASLRYFCRMSVGPGHELSVAKRVNAKVAQTNASKARSHISWGHRSVLFEFKHLADLVNAIGAAAWPNGFFVGARSPEIGTLRTSVIETIDPLEGTSSDLIDDESLADHDVPWMISEALSSQLDEIGTTLGNFAESYLGPMQRRELLQAFNTMRSALRRNDRAGAIRDLIPFFSQLARCFKEIQWEEFLAKPGRFEQALSRELITLVSHVWRALRNRIEQRVQPADPSFPNTLEYGASKLVNAYTVAAWLCWEVLSRGNDENHDSHYCASERFAACVSAGIDGRVAGREVFSSYREYREACLPNNEHLADRPSPDWNSRLLLLNISGPTLFHPEMAFVHCLHEMAEFPNWIMQSVAEPLRFRLNLWLYGFYFTMLRKALSAPSRSLTSDEKDFLGHHIKLTSHASPEYLHNGCTQEKAKQSHLSVLINSNPGDILGHFHRQIVEFGVDESFKTMSERMFFDARPNNFRVPANQKLRRFLFIDELDRVLLKDAASAYGTKRNESSRSIMHSADGLTEKIAETEVVLNEVVPDIGMWIALDHILTVYGTERTYNDRILDLRRIYTSILSSLAHWQTESAGLPGALSMLLTRWAIQYAAVSETHDFQTSFLQELDHCKVLTSVVSAKKLATAIDAVRGLEHEHPGFFSKNPEEKSLVFSVLRSIPAYQRQPDASPGINLPALWTPKPNTPEAALLKSFADLWNAARYSDAMHAYENDRKRLRFIFKLWTKAQKVAHVHVFENSSTTQTMSS